jgi:hypothetical protein
MEEKRDLFTIEVCLAGVVNKVEGIADGEKAKHIREVLAEGHRWVEPVIERPQIADWILEEVCNMYHNNIHNHTVYTH